MECQTGSEGLHLPNLAQICVHHSIRYVTSAHRFYSIMDVQVQLNESLVS